MLNLYVQQGHQILKNHSRVVELQRRVRPWMVILASMRPTLRNLTSRKVSSHWSTTS